MNLLNKLKSFVALLLVGAFLASTSLMSCNAKTEAAGEESTEHPADEAEHPASEEAEHPAGDTEEHPSDSTAAEEQ